MGKQEFLEQFGALLGQEFSKAAPKDTTRLARSFLSTMKVNNDTITYTLPEYAQYVEYGTRSHIIKPKDKEALSWSGAEHPVKVVKHPGTRPNPFMRDTINRKVESVLKQTIKLFED